MALGTNINGKLTAVVTRQSDAGGTASAIGEPMHEAIPQAQSLELLADHSLDTWLPCCANCSYGSAMFGFVCSCVN